MLEKFWRQITTTDDWLEIIKVIHEIERFRMLRVMLISHLSLFFVRSIMHT